MKTGKYIVVSFILLASILPGVSGASDLLRWEGFYRGFIDGRPATLVIQPIEEQGTPSRCNDSVTGEDNAQHTKVNIFMHDVERNVSWSRKCMRLRSRLAPGPTGHIWRDMRLRDNQSRQIINAGTYIQHNSDRDFISGSNIHRGTPFGRLFVRTSRHLPACSHGLSTCRFR